MRKYFYLFLLLTFFSLLFIHDSYASFNYTVKKGDNLYSIAKRFGVTVDAIKEHNNLSSNKLAIGDKLSIPQQNKPTNKNETPKVSNQAQKTEKNNAIASDPFEVRYHQVKKGDTIAKIAKKYSLKADRIMEINGLTSNKLKIGQQLLIKTSQPEAYTVKKGDTLWSIAVKYGIAPDELKEINALEGNSVKVGQKLLLAKRNQEQEDDIHSVNASLPSYHSKLALESASQKLEDVKALAKSEELSGLSIRERLIIFAKKMMHLPYRFGGSTAFGIDCSAYVQKVYGLIGLALPRSAREQFHFGDVIDKDELTVGDLVFFRTYASFPSHVGIYLGNNLFIHASSKTKRITIDSLDTPYYIKRFIGAKRIISDDVLTEEGGAIN